MERLFRRELRLDALVCAFIVLLLVTLLTATQAAAQTQAAPKAVGPSGSYVATQPVTPCVAPAAGASGVCTYIAPDTPIPVADGDIASVAPDAQPTVTASSAYATGNTVGQLLTFSSFARYASLGLYVQEVRLHFKSAQTGPYDFMLCTQNPSATTITDKTAINLSVTDFSKCRVFHVTDCTSLGTPSYCTSGALASPFYIPSGITAYGALIARGTPTFGSTSDVVVALGLVRR